MARRQADTGTPPRRPGARRFRTWFGDDARPHPHPSLIRTAGSDHV
ncbi:hypothetical protein ACQP1S_19145 [Micromonospora matsumotoense]